MGDKTAFLCIERIVTDGEKPNNKPTGDSLEVNFKSNTSNDNPRTEGSEMKMNNKAERTTLYLRDA